jgi:hypothetical protein
MFMQNRRRSDHKESDQSHRQMVCTSSACCGRWLEDVFEVQKLSAVLALIAESRDRVAHGIESALELDRAE